MAAIEVRDVARSFGDVQALQGVDLVVEPGVVVGLLGPNGAGKTTLVRILATLLAPDRGTATVAGHDVVAEPYAVRKAIGLAGQFAAVDEVLTGFENLEMVGRLYHLGRAEAARRARATLSRFRLDEAADRAAGTYSGGMRRRLDLAATLVGDPQVVFLDEPTTGLDPRSRTALWEVVEELKAGGTTILLTTQYLEEADRLADRIAVIDRGTIVAQGTAGELKSRVGGDRLVVHVEDEAGVVAARAELAPLAAGGAAVDVAQTELSIPVDGPSAAAEAVRRLDAAGVALAGLELRRPTLDDVFLALTGRKAEAGAGHGAGDAEAAA